MEITYAFLARAAEANSDGTLAILGADFHVVHAPGFPRLCPMALVIRLTDVSDEQDLTVQLNVTGPGEIVVIDTPVPVPLTRKASAGGVTRPGTANVVLGLNGLVLPTPGEYQVSVRIIGVAAVERVIKLAAEVSNG